MTVQSKEFARLTPSSSLRKPVKPLLLRPVEAGQLRTTHTYSAFVAHSIQNRCFLWTKPEQE